MILLPDGTTVEAGLKPRANAPGQNGVPVFDDTILMSDDECIAAVAKGAGDLTDAIWWERELNQQLDQNPNGWCTWFAWTGAIMAARFLTSGVKELLLPDAGPVHLGVGTGGYPIDWALTKFLKPIGIPPASVAPTADPFKRGGRIGSERSMSSDWKEKAGERRVLKFIECPTNRHLRCAVIKGYPCVGGVFWQDSPKGGHALCTVKIEYEGRTPYLVGPNTWGWLNGWYDHPTRKGWYRAPESKWDVDVFGAFAIVSTIVN